MNWIFKLGDHFHFDSESKKATVTLEQKRNFSGLEGEEALILEKAKAGWQFTKHYRITAVDPGNSELEYKKIIVSLEFIEEFSEDKLLDDYIYSLRRITNYAQPIRHFGRKYNRLYDAEYDAIVGDKIYVKRSILGTILNSMHRDHQEAFIEFVAGEAPALLTSNPDIDAALNLLFIYVNYAIVKPAIYLRESTEILKRIITDNDLEGVGFASQFPNNLTRGTQLIRPQVALIDEHLQKLQNGMSQKVESRSEQFGDNRKFRRLFKNSSLPITLN